jgi:hypothetical protein
MLPREANVSSPEFTVNMGKADRAAFAEWLGRDHRDRIVLVMQDGSRVL